MIKHRQIALLSMALTLVLPLASAAFTTVSPGPPPAPGPARGTPLYEKRKKIEAIFAELDRAESVPKTAQWHAIDERTPALAAGPTMSRLPAVSGGDLSLVAFQPDGRAEVRFGVMKGAGDTCGKNDGATRPSVVLFDGTAATFVTRCRQGIALMEPASASGRARFERALRGVRRVEVRAYGIEAAFDLAPDALADVRAGARISSKHGIAPE
jgi:hypothetical protein